MSIQTVNGANITQKTMVAKQPENNLANGSAFRVQDAQEKAPAKVKIASFLGTLAGVAAAMFVTFKKGKNLENIIEMKNIKDFFHNLTHVVYKDEDKTGKKTYAIEKLIAILTAGSVGGGLLCGSLADKKENIKAKIREAVIQVIGNIFTPLLCVDGGIRLFEKYGEDKVIKALKLSEKTKGVPKAIISIACLVGGLLAGNKVGNTINEKVFNVKDNRKIKLADLSPQLDDACVAVSLVASTSKIGEQVSRFIPAALMIAGYSTGVMQEKTERLSKKEQ